MSYPSWYVRQTVRICVLISCIIISGCMGFGEPTKRLKSSISPSGQTEIIIEYSSPWSFGPHPMHVYGRTIDGSANRGSRRKLLDFELYNDGAKLRKDNCSVRWSKAAESEISTITCVGQEQSPTSYEIDVTDALSGWW